ncbi:unnamed protein product [Rhodiola kirilowii]
MANIYVSEPPTKGKVVLHTTYGPLDIELWPKEAPKAVMNFVQLCLEGYYDNSIFHRIIKGFMAQGGDPTGTGTGGESIYGKTFADEFHSRLRFKYRGLVACANAGVPNTNGSQFFISLDKCDWLDKKNTIFGKVTGDSVYNLLRLGEVETDKDDRPVDPAPKLKSVEVLWNPFEDIIPRVVAKSFPTSTTENKEPKKKPVKKLNLLSFGEEEEKDIVVVKQKIKSSHDVLDDPRLLKEDVQSKELDPSEVKAKKELQLSVTVDHSDGDDGEAYFDARMRNQILMKRKELGDAPAKKKSRQVTLGSDKFSSTGSQSCANSHRSRGQSSDEYTQELMSRLERMESRQEANLRRMESRQEAMKDSIDQMMQMQAAMMRMLTTPGYQPWYA